MKKVNIKEPVQIREDESLKLPKIGSYKNSVNIGEKLAEYKKIGSPYKFSNKDPFSSIFIVKYDKKEIMK